MFVHTDFHGCVISKDTPNSFAHPASVHMLCSSMYVCGSLVCNGEQGDAPTEHIVAEIVNGAGAAVVAELIVIITLAQFRYQTRERLRFPRFAEVVSMTQVLNHKVVAFLLTVMCRSRHGELCLLLVACRCGFPRVVSIAG